jgi:asparagine synthase (glutamine-hydrolysing)
MCGLTGIFHFNKNRIVDVNVLKKMTDVIKHRGPDGEGYYITKNIGIGHRRLSIIDLQTGDQPMFSNDRNIAIVFNGEIYNYLELKEELRAKGYNFISTSDTEVIINAYLEWGVDCQNKFNGMWAFALWDDQKQQLFLSRDRIGEKPLNYCICDNTLIFSSEIKSIFEYGIPREIRPELIELYLVLTNIPAPDTFFKNIYKLKPGCFIIANSEGIKEFKYWDLPDIDENNMLRNKTAIYDEFTHLFEDSVKIRMRSDVPYGAFLSGGLDSSCIVASMSNISSFPVETFTIGFPQRDFDESGLAELVVRRFKTNHYLGTVQSSSIEDAVRISAFHFDEPFSDNSAISTYQVANFAKQNVKMVLTGDGGDEVLSGYDSYAGVKFSNLYSQLPTLLQNALPKTIYTISPFFNGKFRYKLNRIAEVCKSANLPFNLRCANKFSFIPLPIVKKLTSNLKDVIKIEDFFDNRISIIPYKDDFYKLMHLHFKHNLPDDYLVKVDRMSMANSLETRAPFLDYRLIEFMVTVDKSIKMQGWERKSVLRNTVGKRLPKQLLQAPKKGFVVPLSEWFKNDYSDVLSLSNLKTICDQSTINQIIDENRKGKMDNGYFLWTLIMLDKFV